MLNKDQIRDINDRPCEIVHVKEWGGDIHIRAMTIMDRIEFEKYQAISKGQLDLMIHMLIYSCVDQQGDHIFDQNDFDMLSKKSAAVLVKLFEVAIKINTLSKEELENKAKN